jgi:hypothetical protein
LLPQNKALISPSLSMPNSLNLRVLKRVRSRGGGGSCVRVIWSVSMLASSAALPGGNEVHRLDDRLALWAEGEVDELLCKIVPHVGVYQVEVGRAYGYCPRGWTPCRQVTLIESSAHAGVLA